MKGAVRIVLLLALLGWGAGALPGSAQAEPNPFLDLLRFVPDTEQAREFVYLNDIAAAAEVLAGVEPFLPRPAEGADPKTVLDYIALLSTRLFLSSGPYLSGFDLHAAQYMDDLKRRAGYDARDVEGTVLAGSPPNEFAAVRLNRPALEVRDHILNQPEDELPAPEREEHADVSILRWGEDRQIDLEKRLIAPAFDQLGRGSRLGFVNNVLLYTVWLDGIRGMIDARRGARLSLAENEDFALLAAGLRKLGSYSAFATTFTQADGSDPLNPPPDDAIRLKPYRLLGTSIGRAPAGFYMGLALVHADAQAATANVERLRDKLIGEHSRAAERPWAELFEVGGSEIVADGRLLRARIPLAGGEASGIWFSFVARRDPLLLHE